MAKTVTITLTVAGTDTGPFDLYSDADGYAAPFASGISKAALESGYTSVVVPDAATIIRVKSVSSLCPNYVDLTIVTSTTTTTTTTSTTSTTTTEAPGVPVVVKLSNSIDTVCGGLDINTYTTTGVITPGLILYLDSGLTSPVEGFTFVNDFYNTGITYHLNSLSGLIGANTGMSC
jgi:hypothetical protein